MATTTSLMKSEKGKELLTSELEKAYLDCILLCRPDQIISFSNPKKTANTLDIDYGRLFTSLPRLIELKLIIKLSKDLYKVEFITKDIKACVNYDYKGRKWNEYNPCDDPAQL